MQEDTFGAIVIGAGLGGLLSAAQLLQRGKRVVVLERLPHCGGRFTAKTFQGVQVSTGAVHMVPFGSSGVLARMLRHLHIQHRFFELLEHYAPFFCSRTLLRIIINSFMTSKSEPSPSRVPNASCNLR